MTKINPHQYQHLANGVRRIRECCVRAKRELWIDEIAPFTQKEYNNLLNYIKSK